MDISDTSDLSLGARCDHYRKSYGAYEYPVQDPRRKSTCDLADQVARDEMLQEVHTMLRHLIKKGEDA